ncbi:MAG: winged helix-turn-helix transcriptional regulator [Ruminococcus sp.]
MISERVTSGMRNAAAKGKVIGRLHTTVADIPQRFAKSYPLCEKHKINQSELARITGLNRGTVRKYVKMLEEIKTKYWKLGFLENLFYAIKKSEIDLSKKPISQFL